MTIAAPVVQKQRSAWVLTPARAAALEKAQRAKRDRAQAELAAAEASAAALKVLLAGVDTLVLSTRAELRPDVVKELRELREAAHNAKKARKLKVRLARRAGLDMKDLDPCDLPHWRSEVLGLDFEVQPYGVRKGIFVLVSEGMTLIINPEGPRSLPRAYAELRSAFLWSGWDGAASAASSLLRSVTVDEDSQVQVSRLDLAVDFMGWCPEPELLDAVVGRVIRRDPTYEWGQHEHGFKDRPSRAPWVRTHNTGRRFTGFTFGGGELLCRCYDKTVEISRSGKKWFEPLWQKAGWQNKEESGHVWRLEFQVRRDPLTKAELVQHDRALEMKSWDDVKQGLDALWSYLTREWLSYRLPRTAEERCRFHPRWTRLQAARFTAEPDATLYRHQKLYSLERNTGAYAGVQKRELSLHWTLTDRAPSRERLAQDIDEINRAAAAHYALRHDDELFDAARADYERQLKWRQMFGRTPPARA